MTTLAQPPLIEVIFELRWGAPSKADSSLLEYGDNDREFFIGQFQGIARSSGFPYVERVRQHDASGKEISFPLNLLPQVVQYRFRREPDSWPCYQVGVGIFTANQVNEGYDWAPFKGTVLKGLDLLDRGYPTGLAGIPFIGSELRYQDGFVFEEGETPFAFLRNKLDIGYSVPPNLLNNPAIAGELDGNVLSFQVKLSRPKGILIFELQQALINGKPGFVMNTVVRSSDVDRPALSNEAIGTWLEEAHDVQKAVFQSVIKPTYAKSFAK